MFEKNAMIWDVWKECNNRIFKNRNGSTQSIIAQIFGGNFISSKAKNSGEASLSSNVSIKKEIF